MKIASAIRPKRFVTRANARHMHGISRLVEVKAGKRAWSDLTQIKDCACRAGLSFLKDVWRMDVTNVISEKDRLKKVFADLERRLSKLKRDYRDAQAPQDDTVASIK